MLARFLALAAAVVACAAVAAQATAVAPNVQTTLGEVSGFVDDTINCYHGIPVGAPPVGALRFAPPKPASPWTGVFNGSITPPICAQIPILHKDVVGVEDCLTVNVYTPSAGDASKLPVMLWIYGGGWVEGDSWEKGRYNGVKMAKARNVVVVAVNYRLGALGFMSLPALAGENGQVGNVGLLDQRLGMQWVQDNIAAFGGDKTRVAIFGESAGGFSVCFHLVSPGSKGLFSAAIMESGTCESHGFFVPRDQAYDFSNAVAESVQCSGSGADQLACLRSVSVTQLLDSNLTRVPIIGTSLAQAAVKSFYTGLGLDAASIPAATGLTPEMAPIMPWTATIDGVNLLEVPLQSLRANKWADVPVIFGTNLDEGTIFVPALTLVVPGTPFPPDTAAMEKALPHFFSHYTTNTTATQVAAQLTLEHYPLSQFKNNSWHRAAAIMTDWFFTCATRRAARAITDNGGNAWVYQFTQKLPWLEYDVLGDYHGSEVYLVFGYSDLLHPFNSDVTSLSDAMQSYWTSMAYHGTPNSGVSGAPLTWPAFNATALQSIDLSWPLSTVSNLDGSICDFWDATLSQFVHDSQ